MKLDSTAKPRSVVSHTSIGRQASHPSSVAVPNSNQGLRALLQNVDDLLFVLDTNGNILNCKARIASGIVLFPMPAQLSILEILPATVRRKYDLAIKNYQSTNRFIAFESMLATSPSLVHWYEFRLIPAVEDQIVLFIWNVNHYRRVSGTVPNLPFSVDKMIEGWSRSLYLRDLETEDHTRRVTEMTVQLARQLGLPEEDMRHLRRGAQVHDIGKIAIPDSILLKPGKLTEEEWSIMHQHPLIAVEMLKAIPDAEPILAIPRSHHERWDGSGYPDKLAGEDIPLHARIFAFADVYDALTSDRPYRRAWSTPSTLAYIHSQTGRHFDPTLASEFIRMMT
ncbi:MAG: HD-GYP domain-containing protein [Anaerolineales bacterium]|nr:HD-GYP domain-containing protein [Anaerolineales bacterium]